MKRVVIATQRPWEIIPQYPDHSIMIVNPKAPGDRYQYLIDSSDYSLLHTDTGVTSRQGADYPGERILLYTSGTTGDSKFFGFTQAQLDTICEVMKKSYELTAQDRYYGVMPMWHAHGHIMYWASVKAGVECAFGTPQNLKAIETFQPTYVSAVPRVLKAMLKLDLKHLRFVRSASAPLSQELHDTLQDKFGVPVIEAFGMTEAVSHCFTNPLHGERRINTVGLPDGIEARVDEHEHLWIKGPCVHRPNEWIDTGDLATVDDKGYYTIKGRSVDQINVHGIKVNPQSLEKQCLAQFQDIQQVVVYGKDRVKVIYVGEAPEQDVSKWFASLGAHCRPENVEKVDEIPVNDTGKISRTMLQSRDMEILQGINWTG